MAATLGASVNNQSYYRSWCRYTLSMYKSGDTYRLHFRTPQLPGIQVGLGFGRGQSGINGKKRGWYVICHCSFRLVRRFKQKVGMGARG